MNHPLINMGQLPLYNHWQSLRMAADKQVREFETRHDLLRFRLDGWCVWPVLRFSVYSKLENLQDKKISRSEPLRITQKLSYALKDFWRLIFLPASHIVVLVQSSNRSEQIGDKYKDIYFDALLAELGSYVKIENMVNRHYLDRSKAALIPSHLTTTGLQLGVAVLLRLPHSSAIQEIAAALSTLIYNDLGLTEYSPQRISTQLTNFFWSKHLYRLLLQRLQPDYLFLTTSYSYHAIIAAAKEQNIPVIEFQHGLVDRYHNGYSWEQSAIPHKTDMPVPDKIFLYGDFWKDELSVHGFWGSDLITVGSLRMDSYRLHKNQGYQIPPVKLVVTTQNIDIQSIIEYFIRFRELAINKVEFQVIFKLHPGENDKSRYLSAFDSDPNFRVYLGNENPSTYQLLANSDFHISIYSTCHYESIALGVPTIILPFSNHQTVLNLLNSGYAFLADSPEKLLDIINNYKDLTVPQDIGEYYFRSEAVKNIINALEGISTNR